MSKNDTGKTRTSKQKKAIAEAGAGAAAAACILGGVFLGNMNSTQEAAGQKTIEVQVIHKDGVQKDFTVRTDASNLAEALTEDHLISGEEGPYGLFVDTVDGETSDFDKDGSWWQLSVNGREAPKGVSETPVENDAVYTWTYVSE